MPIYQLENDIPVIPADAFVAPNATIIGKVKLGQRASVWFGAVLRGDNEWIEIGDDSNVQEGAVLHTDLGFPLTVAASVTIGHQAMLHGCTVGYGSLIGIQAIVMNGAVIGRNCLVGAGAIVTEKKSFPDGSLILGAPAKLVRALSAEEISRFAHSAQGYATRGGRYRQHLQQIG